MRNKKVNRVQEGSNYTETKRGSSSPEYFNEMRFIGFKRKLGISEDPLKNELQLRTMSFRNHQ